jgi:hypothetical protein
MFRSVRAQDARKKEVLNGVKGRRLARNMEKEPSESAQVIESFELVQELMAVSSVYRVRKTGTKETVFTVFGAFATTSPRFNLVQGSNADAEPMASLQANVLKTQYEILSGNKTSLGSLVFPAVAFKKTLQLTVRIGETEVLYKADGGVFKGVFTCGDAAGNVALEIDKMFGIRDGFVVRVHAGMPLEVALLSAVALHSRYYELLT